MKKTAIMICMKSPRWRGISDGNGGVQDAENGKGWSLRFHLGVIMAEIEGKMINARNVRDQDEEDDE